MNQSKWSAYQLTIGALFVALMAVGANITAFAPFLSILGVPLTLQTFFAIMAGLILGSRLGFFSILVYILLGLVGAPVFAGFSGGIGDVLSPTFGFLLSYMILAFVVGKIAEQKRTLPVYITAAFVGVAINYVIGVNWFYFAMNFWAGTEVPFFVAWANMMPFLIKDLALTVVAGVLAHRLEKTVLKRTPLAQARAS